MMIFMKAMSMEVYVFTRKSLWRICILGNKVSLTLMKI